VALGRSTDLSVDINGDASGYERAVASAERATASAQRALQSYDRNLSRLGLDIAKLEKQLDDDLTAALKRQHDAMDKTGKGMLLFGGAVAAGLALAGREAMRWESAWTGVQKTVSGTPEQLASLEKQLRQLAKTLPTTHEEIAGVAEAAGQLGVATPSIASFTKVMIDLAQTTNLTAEDAATKIAQLMNVMRSAPDDVDNLGAALVALGNNGASTEADILSLAQRLSGAGKLIGASEQDVLALAASMANLGIEAELGGGAASRALTKMYSAVRSGGPVLEEFARTAGMSAEQFAASFNEDPIRAVDAFLKGLGRIDASGGNVVQVLGAVGLAGTQNAQVLLRLSGAGDQLSQSLDLSNRSWEENTALVVEATQRYETAESRAKIAANTIRDGAIDIGAHVLPIFADVVDVVANIAIALGDLPGPVKGAITVLALLTAAVALAGGAALVAVPKIAAFKVAVDGLQAGALKTAGTRLMGLAGILAGPWGAALGVGITVLGVFAAKHGEAAREVDALKATLNDQTGAISDNSRQWAIKKLSDEGALQAADALGLNLATVTDAVLEQGGALDELKPKLQAIIDAGTSITGQGPVFTPQALSAQKLLDVISDGNGVLAKSREEWRLEHEAMGDAADSTSAAGAAADGTAGSYGTLTNETSELTDETKTLKDAFDELSGAFLDERDAGRAVRDQLRNIRKATRDYREEHGDLVGAFKKGTKTGDDFQGMLDDLAKKYQDKVDATLRATGSEKQAQVVLKESREKLRAVADQLGMTKDEARKYVREVLGIPKIRKTDAQNNFPAATEDAKDYNRLLDLIDGRTVNTWVKTHFSNKPAPVGIAAPNTLPKSDPRGLSPRELTSGRAMLDSIAGRQRGGGSRSVAGFLGGQAAPITAQFLMSQLGVTPPKPNLNAYTKALAEQAKALQAVRDAEVAVKKARKTKDKKDDAKAEKELAKAKAAHAAATDKVKAAVQAYAAAQEAAVAHAHAVAEQAREGGGIFGGGFIDVGSVSRRIQATIARIRKFAELRRRLVAAGIHPALLAELDDEGPTEAAIQFATELLNTPGALAGLNKQAAQLQLASNQLGADTAAIHGRGPSGAPRRGHSSMITNINVVVNAPQTMSPEQVGAAVAARLLP